jgi:hypothetical protein
MDARGGVRALAMVLGVSLLAGACARTGSHPAAATTSSSTTTSTPPTTTGPQLSGGYLAQWTNGAIFVQLTTTGPATFEGTAVFRLLSKDGPGSGTNHFAGSASGDSLVFRFGPHLDQGRWPAYWSAWSGSLFLDGTFTVQLPSPDGRLAVARFVRGTAAEYQNAVKRARP